MERGAEAVRLQSLGIRPVEIGKRIGHVSHPQYAISGQRVLQLIAQYRTLQKRTGIERLPVRAYNCLRNANIDADQLWRMNAEGNLEALLDLPNFGASSLLAVRDWLGRNPPPSSPPG